MKPGRAALLYLLFGTLWILISDQILTTLSPTTETYQVSQTQKGLLYVLLTSLLIYWLARRSSAAANRGLAWYQELFSIGPDAIFVIDEHGRFIDANRVAVERYGYTKAELLQMGPADLATPDKRDLVPEVVAHGLEQAQTRKWQHVKRNGEVIEVEFSGQPVRLEGRPCILVTVRDVTEVKRSLAARSESEAFQRALIEATPVALFAIDFDGTVLFWNDTCEHIFGWTADEVAGHRLPLAQGERSAEFDVLRDQIRAGDYFHGKELVRQRKDGSLIDVRLSVAPLRDADGNVTGIMSAMEDITESKRNEQRLHYQERLLQQMERLAAIGAWELDAGTGEVTWTDEVARIHDLEPGTEVDLEAALGFYTPEARTQIEAAVAAAVEHGVPYDLELEIITAAGERRWVKTIGQPVTVGGRVVRVNGSFQDITERRQAEDRIDHLNRLLRAVRDINQLIARERNRSLLLQQACDLLVQHRSYSGSLLVLTGSDDRPLQWAHAGKAPEFGPALTELAEGRLPDCFQAACAVRGPQLCPAERSAKDAAPTSILCHPLTDGGATYGVLAVPMQHDVGLEEEEQELLAELADDLAYALGVLADRDARAQAEHDRDELERQLAQASRMEAVGQLAGGVAHDFNNLLQAILGYAELLLASDSISPDDRELTEEIRKAGERAATLTRQLLAFSRRQVMQPKVLDLNDVIADLLNMVRRLIGEHIELAWRPASKPANVLADAGMIEQVIVNLCVNARDAMTHGGQLTIAAEDATIDEDFCAVHPWAEPGRFVMLNISDTGCGMDRATLDHIFEPFFTTKSDGRGTGLGLATVYGIVKQHQGMIHAYSEPGVGTTFRIYLPVSEEQADSRATLAPEAAAQGCETILLAEDDELVRALATTILQRAGYRVLAAADGDEAVALFAAHGDEISAAVLDVVMPQRSGPQVYEALRASRPELPVLFSSGYSEAAIHTDFVLHKGLALLQKPYAPTALLRHVRALCDQAAGHQT